MWWKESRRRGRGWDRTRCFGSTAEWLAWRIGLRPGAARERVRTARALTELPLTAAALRAGEVSFTKVRALTRVARPGSEAALLELARSCSAARLERRLRAWTSDARSAEATSEARRHRARTFSVFPGEDGSYVVRGRLEPEVGAVLMRALEAASDALYRLEVRGAGRGDGGGERRGAGERGDAGLVGGAATPEQRRADALGLVAERALAAGFRDGPLSGSRAERYQVVLHVEQAALAGDATHRRGSDDDEAMSRAAMAHAPLSAQSSGQASARVSAETSGDAPGRVSAETSGGARTNAEAHGVASGRVSAETSPGVAGTNGAVPRPRSELEDGVRVSAETSRRLACDAAVVTITRRAGPMPGGPAAHGDGGTSVTHRGGSVLDVGRRTRTVPPALRRALEARDRGCRFPGCGSRFTDAHHLVHWADGGPTRLDNLLLLCRRHHRAVHEGRVRACRGADDSVAFFTPGGRVLYDAPPGRRARGTDGTAAGAMSAVTAEQAEGTGPANPPAATNATAANVTAVTATELRLDRPPHRNGAARWARDRDVPWGIEVRALDAIEKAAGW